MNYGGISLQDMYYVCALAKHLNFGKAAAACYTSQPNVSMQLKTVEKELGFTLFERSNKMVRTTAKGRQTIAVFATILTQMDDIKHLASQTYSGPFKLGLFPTLAPCLIPKILPALKDSFPKVSFEMIEDKTHQLIDQLKAGELDAILIAHPENEPSLQHSILFEDPFLVAVPHNSPLAKRAFLTIEQLKNERILLLEEGHCLRDQSLDICQAQHLPIDKSLEFTSLETLRAMVAAGEGITFMPELCCDAHPQVRYIPLAGKTLSRTIALYWRSTVPDSKSFHTIASTIQNSKRPQ